MALESQVLNLNKGLVNFTHEVEKAGGENISVCYQCGTCTGSCPMGRRNALRTRKIMRMTALGLKDELLKSDEIWYCSTCYTCTDRCPRHVKPTDVIIALRNMATRQHIVPKNFLATAGFIYQTGHGVPNNDANRALRKKLGLTAEPPTTHMYPEYIPGIQKILEATGLMAIKAAVEGGKK
ncbi:CoB--CoM heterodisulfide reductase subunit C [Methanocella conradii]|uniref:CoB--CoM heterodisulfide reductase subunit C n=1 Tax=Methanocella conradii TaxID=1175444 RepID=UPI00157E2B3C|nr:CoB--CoM heterodisulfide reductase subunit C [Methanocella conradii]